MTINTALNEAGIISCHGKTLKDHLPVAIYLWRAFVEAKNPFFYIPCGFEAIADPHLTRSRKFPDLAFWPTHCPLFLQKVVEHNPETLILLNTRDPEKWLTSVSRWKDLRERITKSDLPFLPPSYGSEDSELIDWISAYYDRVRKLKLPNFLEIDIEDEKAPAKIGQALGIPLPWWGIANANTNQEESENAEI